MLRQEELAFIRAQLASSGSSSQPANWRPGPTAGSASLPAISAVTGEQAATCSRQHVSPEGEAPYATPLAQPVAPFQASGLLKPTAMDSYPSESDVSSETVNSRMSSDMSGPRGDKPYYTTSHSVVTNAFLAA
jgi:hypothetical protein